MATRPKSKSIKSKVALHKRKVFTMIPKEILNNKQLNEAIELLPPNYNFEIHKTIWRIKREEAKRVALQFPEGLLIFSCIISDILERFGGVGVFIMGGVTYGACCIDDITAKSLECDLVVHYGHSCLVPITTTTIPTLYVFVEMSLNKEHFVSSIKLNFRPETHIALCGTIQFVGSIYATKKELEEHFDKILIPQERPLAYGEILGCTSPLLPEDLDALIFVADGRFHLESLMIRNPHISSFYRYNPYDRKLTTESYDFKRMMELRSESIQKSKHAKTFCVILSTLGRQGNPGILKRIEALLKWQRREYFVVLLSDISPEKLDTFPDEIDAYIQIGCPRISIDWGCSFRKPLLNPYEAFVALQGTKWKKDSYPMDYYSKNGKEWSNYYSEKNCQKKECCGNKNICC